MLKEKHTHIAASVLPQPGGDVGGLLYHSSGKVSQPGGNDWMGRQPTAGETTFLRSSLQGVTQSGVCSSSERAAVFMLLLPDGQTAWPGRAGHKIPYVALPTMEEVVWCFPTNGVQCLRADHVCGSQRNRRKQGRGQFGLAVLTREVRQGVASMHNRFFW